MQILLSGAAPLSRQVEEFLRVISCSNLSQGYGMIPFSFYRYNNQIIKRKKSAKISICTNVFSILLVMFL